MIAAAWVISLVLWPPWIYAWPYIEGDRKVPEGKSEINVKSNDEPDDALPNKRDRDS